LRAGRGVQADGRRCRLRSLLPAARRPLSAARLDTTGIDDKYRDRKTGLPMGSIKALADPYPAPSLR